MGAFFVFFLWTAHSVFILDIATIYAENEFLENLQVIVLSISLIFFLIPIVIEKKPGTNKLILFFCSLLCYNFILRELDFNKLDVNDTIKFICSGVGRNIILSAAYIAIFTYAILKFSYYVNAGISFIRSKSGILLMSGGFFLIVGDLFEKISSLAHHSYWEELFELCGFCFILLSAFAANAGLNRRIRHSG
jgi:hypothetical protein